jgi:A/G-specific adenine glycosylase
MAASVATAIIYRIVGSTMRALLDWFDHNARPLPWRVTKVTPWESLLAEIILQQTRMETGIPYWEKIRSAYPTPSALADDTEENLLHLWQGCGYYARARNLYKLALQLDGGPLPETYSQLLKLPGIGPYTAAAIASIAFDEPVACVDGNVRRVISRLNAQDLTDSQLQEHATSLLYHKRPGDWNQAMMELGSQICTPKNPNCTACPLGKDCLAHASGNPTQWPKSRTTKQTKISAAVLVIGDGKNVFLSIREGRTLGGLWGVPYAEGHTEIEKLLEGRNSMKIGELRHDFTHKRLNITVYRSPPLENEILRDPDSVPLATLDRKVLALYMGYLGEEP